SGGTRAALRTRPRHLRLDRPRGPGPRDRDPRVRGGRRSRSTADPCVTHLAAARRSGRPRPGPALDLDGPGGSATWLLHGDEAGRPPHPLDSAARPADQVRGKLTLNELPPLAAHSTSIQPPS